LSADAADAPVRPRPLGWGFWAFIAFMLALTALFVSLGLWQVERLRQKQVLIANVASRLNLDPLPLPPLSEWVGFDAEIFDYRPVSFSGHFVPQQSVLVFASLDNPKGQYGGPGYWVMAPFALTTGGSLFVNRGFIPQQQQSAFAAGGPVPGGELTLTGIGRTSEEPGSFTPGPDAARRIEWVRNVPRLAKLADAGLAPFAPIYVDLPLGEAGALPQGGETTLSFPNNHFGYILTWFGFALLTPILLVFWIIRQLRGPAKPQNLR
jgi:surfeit locus 1 family protein